MKSKLGISTAILGFIGVFFLISLSIFFTNDDFFLLKISQASSISDFIGFFNPFYGPDGLGMYRPLTIQVYYFLARNIFASAPQILRIVSFLAISYAGYLVYQLAVKLSNSKSVGWYSVFFYLVSATHFAHLAYSATFQEIGLTIFVLLGVLSLWKNAYFSVLYFVFALLSKETAIVYPILMSLVYVFYSRNTNPLSRTRLILIPLAYAAIMSGYAYFRFFHYGFAAGDSYIWEISPKIINTSAWYLLWSLNLPEMWVDFIGPGLKINPNLVRFWGRESFSILLLFLIIALSFIKTLAKSSLKSIIFTVVWFLASLGPLLLLPWHKFTFYLTLPMVGLAIFLAVQISKAPANLKKIILISWFLLSWATLSLTIKTNWISNGAQTAYRLHSYLKTHPENFLGKSLVFYDQISDDSLPWQPTQVVKTALSDNNYFQVYWPGTSAVYLSQKPAKIDSSAVYLPARQFIGY